MRKIRMGNSETIEGAFELYMTTCAGKGLSQKTINTYKNHFYCIGKYLPVDGSLMALRKADVDGAIGRMREKGLATNSIASYIRTLKAFLTWAKQEGMTDVVIPCYKPEETVKATYTDEELKRLLKKPNLKTCRFTEFRDWAIINLLVNNGCRAGSVRAIQNRDVDLDNAIVSLRHTKTRKVQILPLCSVMVGVLKEYMKIRQGEPQDYLFCDEGGDMLSENALRCTIVKYNHSRGVRMTSIHAFRHTFARKYLVDYGGNALTLQKLLGHATLSMTKHYCAIFDADITKNFDYYSPLAQLSKGTAKISMG